MMTEKIKIALIKRKMVGKIWRMHLDAAVLKLFTLLKKDNWNEKQLRKISDILNCDLEMSFRLRNTGDRI